MEQGEKIDKKNNDKITVGAPRNPVEVRFLNEGGEYL